MCMHVFVCLSCTQTQKRRGKEEGQQIKLLTRDFCCDPMMKTTDAIKEVIITNMS